MKNIFTAAQNETVRKKSGDKDAQLLIIGLINCVGVLIKDEHGNASLTHVDKNTDLDFIRDEVAFMEGEYTIDIIKDKDNPSDLPAKVSRYLEIKYPDILNSKGNKEIRRTQKQCVLFNGESLKIADPYFVAENTTPGARISDENPFKREEYTIHLGNEKKPFQSRIYNHQIYCYLKPNTTRKPDVVYDGEKWNDEMFTLPEDIAKKFEELLLARSNPLRLIAMIKDHIEGETGKSLDKCPESARAQYLIQFPQLIERIDNYLSSVNSQPNSRGSR